MKSRSGIRTEPTAGVPELVEEVFRRSSGRLVAALVRALGPRHLELAEESVQDALLQALRSWPFSGIPERPESWLVRTASNRAIDRLRRRDRWEAEVDPEALTAAVEALGSPGPVRGADPGSPLEDDELAMLFLCCAPEVPADGAVALTLRTVGGLSTREIARAFLVPEATMAQRIVRAKRRFQEHREALVLPAPDSLPLRRDRVLKTLYLMFTEGYAASGDDRAIRAELCREAIRLTGLLAGHPATQGPMVDAQMALFLLHGSRLGARLSGGGIVPLEAQDRNTWDREMIARGFLHLDRARGGPVTAVHLEAGIAAEHAIAPSFDETAWSRIVAFYDRLVEVAPSPAVSLNRAVAVGMRDGAPTGLAALEALQEENGRGDRGLHRPLGWSLPAARAFLLERAGRRDDAGGEWRTAATLAPSSPVREWLLKRARV